MTTFLIDEFDSYPSLSVDPDCPTILILAPVDEFEDTTTFLAHVPGRTSTASTTATAAMGLSDSDIAAVDGLITGRSVAPSHLSGPQYDHVESVLARGFGLRVVDTYELDSYPYVAAILPTHTGVGRIVTGTTRGDLVIAIARAVGREWDADATMYSDDTQLVEVVDALTAGTDSEVHIRVAPAA